MNGEEKLNAKKKKRKKGKGGRKTVMRGESRKMVKIYVEKESEREREINGDWEQGEKFYFLKKEEGGRERS